MRVFENLSESISDIPSLYVNSIGFTDNWVAQANGTGFRFCNVLLNNALQLQAIKIIMESRTYFKIFYPKTKANAPYFFFLNKSTRQNLDYIIIGYIRRLCDLEALERSGQKIFGDNHNG